VHRCRHMWVYATPARGIQTTGAMGVSGITGTGSPTTPVTPFEDHQAQTLAHGNRKASPIAIMGHTGEGIDTINAPCSLELNLLLNSHFSDWYHDTHAADVDRHGHLHGINLTMAIYIVAVLLSRAPKRADLTVADLSNNGEEPVPKGVLFPVSPRGLNRKDNNPGMLKGEMAYAPALRSASDSHRSTA